MKWKAYFAWIGITEAVGALSGWLARDAIGSFSEIAVQPALTPPPWVFPVVWTILYALMGIGAARVWMSEDSAARTRGLELFAVQLLVNFLWTPIFFGQQAYGFALVWLILLIVLVVAMTVSFYRTDRLAALLQIPYILWLLVALYLNAGVWLLNR